MDGEYDVIVLGTGLKECIISGLLSVEGKKVLHLDRNDYYGGHSASLNLAQLFQQFRDGATVPDNLGSARDYNVDVIPKFIMAAGKIELFFFYYFIYFYLFISNAFSFNI